MSNELVKVVMELLKDKVKEHMSDIERDMFDTANELLKTPFDYNSAFARMAFNYLKYDMTPYIEVTQPQAYRKSQLSPQEVADNLLVQLSYLYNINKEQNNG